MKAKKSFFATINGRMSIKDVCSAYNSFSKSKKSNGELTPERFMHKMICTSDPQRVNLLLNSISEKEAVYHVRLKIKLRLINEAVPSMLEGISALCGYTVSMENLFNTILRAARVVKLKISHHSLRLAIITILKYNSWTVADLNRNDDFLLKIFILTFRELKLNSWNESTIHSSDLKMLLKYPISVYYDNKEFLRLQNISALCLSNQEHKRASSIVSFSYNFNEHNMTTFISYGRDRSDIAVLNGSDFMRKAVAKLNQDSINRVYYVNQHLSTVLSLNVQYHLDNQMYNKMDSHKEFRPFTILLDKEGFQFEFEVYKNIFHSYSYHIDNKEEFKCIKLSVYVLNGQIIILPSIFFYEGKPRCSNEWLVFFNSLSFKFMIRLVEAVEIDPVALIPFFTSENEGNILMPKHLAGLAAIKKAKLKPSDLIGLDKIQSTCVYQLILLLGLDRERTLNVIKNVLGAKLHVEAVNFLFNAADFVGMRLAEAGQPESESVVSELGIVRTTVVRLPFIDTITSNNDVCVFTLKDMIKLAAKKTYRLNGKEHEVPSYLVHDTLDMLRQLARNQYVAKNRMLNYTDVIDFLSIDQSEFNSHKKCWYSLHQYLSAFFEMINSKKKSMVEIPCNADYAAIDGAKANINGISVSLVNPKTGLDLYNWGKTQKHCVGTYTNRLVEKKTWVFACFFNGVLRYCVEIFEGKLIQFKGYRNSYPTQDDFNAVKSILNGLINEGKLKPHEIDTVPVNLNHFNDRADRRGDTRGNTKSVLRIDMFNYED